MRIVSQKILSNKPQNLFDKEACENLISHGISLYALYSFLQTSKFEQQSKTQHKEQKGRR